MTSSPAPTRGAFRVCRGAMLAVTSAVLAVVAHAAAGGGLPSTGLTVLLTVGVAAAGIAMAGRRRSALAILGVLGVAQVAIHVLLSVQVLATDGMAMYGMPFDGGAMIGAHAIAVVLSAGLLARADAAVFAVAALLAMVLPTVLRVPPAPRAPAGPRPFPAPVDRTTVRILSRGGNARRGPPVTA